MLAVYDLSRAPPTWDFANWLVQAEMERASRGAPGLRVAIRPGPAGGFRDDQLPPGLDERRYMLAHIVRPLIGLIGAEPADGDAGEGVRCGYTLARIVEAARRGQPVPRFRASAHAAAWVDRWLAPGYITITLREAEHWPQRNSRTDDWLRVATLLRADGRRVIIVRDTAQAAAPLLGYETAPWAAVDVDLRCALYAGAALNLGVANGPALLQVFGDAPWLLFKQLAPGNPTQTPDAWRRLGIEPGEQFPWSLQHQRMAWADDGFDQIAAAIDGLGVLCPAC